MEFESPDVERDFPGLYASEAGKRSNESDFSDESHEKLSKKDLLIGKRKDKKDKKDRGYATLEGESSPEEDPEMRSPSKVKKLKPFKFSSKKEKREKSRDKEVKEKESDKDKKKAEEKEKEKKKEAKVKLKFKEKKKDKKCPEDVVDISEDLPIFGVPLSVAVERSKCHDGVDIPLVVRNCIDHIQDVGLTAENVYKVSGIKSRVQQVKKMYNNHEPVRIADYDLPVATSLLKLFLRELPEPVLTNGLLERFEEAGAIKEALERGEKFKELVKELPSCNRTLLGWTLVHLDQVTQHEKHNKMNAQAIGTTLSPLLQVSQRLLTALLCHALDLFPDIKLIKYVPPLKSVSPGLPETPEGLALELSKQESLLAHLHREMAQGLAGQDRVEQLWTVQRTVTHLKRMLRSLEKTSGQRSLDEPDSLVLHRHDAKISPGDQSKTLEARIPEEKTVPHSLTIPPPLAFQNSVSAPNSILNPPVSAGPPSVPPVSLPSLASLPPLVTQLPAPLPPPISLPTVLPPTVASSIATLPPPAAPALSSLPTPLPPPAAIPPPPSSVSSIPPPAEKSLTLDRKASLFQGYDDDSIWASPCKLTAEQKSATIGTMRGRVPLPTDSTNPWKRRPPLVQQEESVLVHKQVPTAESLEVQDINRESTEKADRMQKAIIESEELMNFINKLKAECENERADINKLKEKIQLLGGIPDLWGMLSDSSDDDASSPDSESNILWKRRQDLRQETKMLQLRKRALIESITSEQDAIIDLKVQIKFLQLNRV
ncbi:hypothetical protein GE061_006516 [Apolygus lucorum]|uniref:Rho-GAP domain-containing protein n=1 Tax=Apolygus lucorum TaxID=248454 RepID=A0A8S9WU46_APOLU|nr:hypothetical protein GE061_006516 [Apolygus lucorum]